MLKQTVVLAAILFLCSATRVSSASETEAPAAGGKEKISAEKDNTETDNAERDNAERDNAERDNAERDNAERDNTERRTPETEPRRRAFRFVYGATITGLKPGAKARVWIPLATDSPWQKVRRTATHVPGALRESVEPRFKNRILYTETTADKRGEIPIEIVYEVVRTEFVPGNATNLTDEDKETFTKASLKIPVDGTLRGRLLPESVIKQGLSDGKTRPLGRTLYDVVNHQMRYDKPLGEPWGRGDALWACDSGFGNCTDFHSLFIGLCRDMGIPAKFEIGFPIPTDATKGEVGGYHCWAMFSEADRWVAVDISEADKHPELTDYYYGRLTPDRVAFTTGRDLRLEPPPAAESVNFLIYPHVEVEGQPHTEFRKQFRFEPLRR